MSASSLIHSTPKTKYQPIESDHLLEHYNSWCTHKARKWENKNPGKKAHEDEGFLGKIKDKVCTFFTETPAVILTLSQTFSDYIDQNPPISKFDRKNPVIIINHGFGVNPNGNDAWIESYKKLTNASVYNHDLGLYTLIAEKVKRVMEQTMIPLLEAGHRRFVLDGHSEGCLVNYFLKQATELKFSEMEQKRANTCKDSGAEFRKRKLSFLILNTGGVFNGSPMALPLAHMPIPDSNLKIFQEAKKLKDAASEITPGSEASKTASKIAIKGKHIAAQLFVYSINDELAKDPTARPPEGVKNVTAWKYKREGHASLWSSKEIADKKTKWVIKQGFATLKVTSESDIASQQG